VTRPSYIRFHLEPIDDEELSCIFCGLPRCDQGFQAAGGGKRSIYGVHNTCVDRHMDKLLGVKPAESDG